MDTEPKPWLDRVLAPHDRLQDNIDAAEDEIWREAGKTIKEGKFTEKGVIRQFFSLVEAIPKGIARTFRR